MNKFNKNIEAGLLEFCLNADKQTIQETLLSFEQEDVNEDALIKRIQFLAQSSLKKQKNDSLLNVIATKFKEAIEQNTDKPINMLKSLIIKGELGVQFRNLDSLSEEDIKDLIRDKNLQCLLEELDDESQNED